MIKNKISLLTFLLLFAFVGTAQNTVIKGKVTTFDIIAVIQTEVIAKKSKVTVISDSLGAFEIEADLKDKLIFKAVGFKTRIIKVKKVIELDKINLEIEGAENEIDNAVTNGYIKETSLADAKKIYKQKNAFSYGYNNLTLLMQTKFPNLQIEGDEIIMRGKTSLTGGNNGALIILNGTTYNWGSVKNLDVQTIKNIKIMSGSAATRYGTGSGNGVIVIELVSE